MNGPSFSRWIDHTAHEGRQAEDAAIAALLDSQTIIQAAQKIGISERTLRTWMKIPEYRQAYQQARRECVDQATSRLQRNFEFPISVLQKIAGDASVTAYARVAAAKVLVDAGFKAIELGDMTERLRKIEERLMQSNTGFKPTVGTGVRWVRKRLDYIEQRLPPAPKRGCEVCCSTRFALLSCPDGRGTRPTQILGGGPLPERCPGCGGDILDGEPPFRILFSVVRTKAEN